MNRAAAIERLERENFDFLVIGGGATGSGVALEAASRGLKVALVERFDFSEGTSSRSTKLIHGGVRYLELAVKNLDRVQLNLVRDALHERATLLRIAPHLSRPLWLLTPLYKAWEAPYYWFGLKLYDLLAGKGRLEMSRYLTA
ncbi:MAG: glycerol-3-phosphate dehydrogenase, partial [Armatimonadota bacterium]